MSLYAEVHGGRIVEEAARFGSDGFWGSVAHVYRAPTESPASYALTIAARDDALAGEPLTEVGEAGHVELFGTDLHEREDGFVSGYVELYPQSIVLDMDETILDDSAEEEIASGGKQERIMKRRIAKLVIEKCAARISLHSSKDE